MSEEAVPPAVDPGQAKVHDLFRAWAGQWWRPIRRDPPWQWALDNVRLTGSPYGDRFLIDETPWLREPMEAIADNRVRELVLLACAQGGKSISMQIGLLWALAEHPDPSMWVAQTDMAAKMTMRQRIIPMIESNPTLATSLPTGEARHKKTLREIIFPNCVLMSGGANESFLRGHTVRWLFCDEASDWEPGRLEQARARTTRFWNRRIVIGSTPLECGSDFQTAFEAGDQREWHVGCVECGEPLYLRSGNMGKLLTWTGETEAESKATAGVTCPKCSTRMAHTDAVWREGNRRGRYIAKRPDGGGAVSFAFNAFCLPPSVLSWGDLAAAWCRGKVEERKGSFAPLREFVTLRLAEFWDERLFLSVEMPNFEAYDVKSDWKDEKFRCMTVDVQQDLASFWCVVRAWGPGGASRLLAFRKCHSEQDLLALREEFVVKPHLVFLDCGYEQYRVFEACVKHGWTALRGEDVTDYGHVDGKRGVRRPYSPIGRGDPRSGLSAAGRMHCPLFRWSNPSIKDLLWKLKSGKGAGWAVCELGPMEEEYAKQLDSERKRETIGRDGKVKLFWKRIRKDNHAWDCECMQVVAACMGRLFGSESAPETSG
mgnify:CR=1 FL=1